MMVRRSTSVRLFGCVAAAALVVACGDGDDAADPTTAPTDAPSTPSASTTGAPATTTTGGAGSVTTGVATTSVPLLPVGEPTTVVGGLDVPWGIAHVDADTFFVTERPGQVRLVDGGQLRREPVASVDVAADGEGGLLGIALHPDFADERFAYLYFTAADGNRISRFPVDEELRFGEEEVLLGGMPAARFHDGGRLAFGPDGHLYATVGDATSPELAADPGALAGKILRMGADGAVPADNPFPDSYVYSYGHRNPQGLAWDADGNLYSSEHGPTGEFGLCCHDEINLIVSGGFYGWPYRAGLVAAADGEPPVEPIDPVAASGDDTWAPAGTSVVATEDGHAVLVATLEAERLLRFDVPAGDPPALAAPDVALEGFGRLRVAQIGPDGCLWLATSNTDGRGSPDEQDDRILRSC